MRYGSGFGGGPNIPKQFAIIFGVWITAKITANRKPPPPPPGNSTQIHPPVGIPTRSGMVSLPKPKQ